MWQTRSKSRKIITSRAESRSGAIRLKLWRPISPRRLQTNRSPPAAAEYTQLIALNTRNTHTHTNTPEIIICNVFEFYKHHISLNASSWAKYGDVFDE